MQDRALQRILLDLRRRFLWVGSVAGIGWGLAAGLLCLLSGVWLDLIIGISPELRIATLILTALGGLTILAIVIGLFFRSGILSSIASRLDRVAQTGGQIRSGFDLSDKDQPITDSVQPELTRQLADLAVTKAATLAGSIPSAQAVPIDPARRSLVALFALSAIPIAMILFLPRVAKTEWGRFLDPYGDHPEYTSLELQVEPEGAQVIYGEGLDIHVTAAGGIAEEVELILESTDKSSDSRIEVLPMFPESTNRWRASISNVTVPLTYHVRTRDARSRRFAIDVITVPKIEEVRFRVVGPAYARIPIYEGGLPQQGLTGLPGTRVELKAVSNRPLSGGHVSFLSDLGEQTIELNSIDGSPNEVRGEMTVNEQGRFSLHVTDVSGQSSTEPFIAPFGLLKDDRPFVRLIQPPAVSFATPTANVPVVISAEDDFGISRLQLFRSLNDSRYLPLEIPISSPPPVRSHEVISLPFSSFQLEPGDEIKLFARVEDNDPTLGGSTGSNSDRVIGKGSESSVVSIRIISQQEFDRMRRSKEGMKMLASKYQQARRRLEQLNAELEEMQKKLEEQTPDSELSESDRKSLEELKKRLEEEAKSFQEMSEQSLPYDLDKELSPQLQQQSEQLKKLAEQMQKLSENQKATNKSASEQLKEMRKSLGQQREKHEQDAMQPVELIEALLPLMKDQSRFVQLAQQQRDLANRLESLKQFEDTDDPAVKVRMRELEAEQNQLREAIEQLNDDIDSHVASLPEDPRLDKLRETAQQFSQALRDSGAADAMDSAEQNLAKFNGQEGHANAQRAADILESLISQCNGMGKACKNCLPSFNPSLSACMSQTLDQLLADAGMKPGMGNGFGQGAGSGYSSQQSSMQNVGLFGSQPLIDQSASARSGNSQDAQDAEGSGSAYRNQNQEDLTTFGISDGSRATGLGETVVPLPYRRKVGRYFQRLADEVGDQ